MTEKGFYDIPGTTLFDANQSRQGYHLNMFCMSLMKAENRKAFIERTRKSISSASRCRTSNATPCSSATGIA